MTRYGGECYAMAMIVAGRIDLVIETPLQPYDIVALIPIIERVLSHAWTDAEPRKAVQYWLPLPWHFMLRDCAS